MKPVVRPATADDIRKLYQRDAPRTVRAFAVDWHGELAAIAGVTIQRDVCTFFSDIRPDIDPPAMAIWRASVEIVNRIQAMKLPCIAIANPELPTSSAYLERLGFTYHGDSDEGRIYRL